MKKPAWRLSRASGRHDGRQGGRELRGTRNSVNSRFLLTRCISYPLYVFNEADWWPDHVAMDGRFGCPIMRTLMPTGLVARIYEPEDDGFGDDSDCDYWRNYD